MKKNLKRIHVACIIVLLFVGMSIIPDISASFFSKSHEIQESNSIFLQENIVVSVQNNEDIITVTYQIQGFSIGEVSINGEQYQQVFLDDESKNMLKGKPDLPNICRSVIIPDNLKMDIKVTYSQYEEYNGIKIAPSKGNMKRDVNPEDVPYEFDEIYNENKWFPEDIAELDDTYILRDFRGQVIKINPFQYNPVEETLRFYTEISVELYPVGLDTVNCITRTESLSAIDTDFLLIYERHFINFDRSFYNPVEEQGNMLVITYDFFWEAMLPFVQWKNMKGIPTEMVNVSKIGDASAIKNYIVDYFNNNGLTFVLLVGDIIEIPTLYRSGGASDPSYSYVVGSDSYPDLFVGRFSALTIAQVETQVERSIDYEKNPQEDADWYHKGIGIASNQGPGDDDEYDNQHMDNIRTDLLDYTYTVIDQIYAPGATAPQVTSALNEGRSVINYCGHGWSQGWSTTGFSISNVNALSNDNMLPFIWSVACDNGRFDAPETCFAEAWLRATYNDEPAGAVATFMSSITQSWSPPMDAQDEFVDLLVESYENNTKHTFGGISFSGCMHMNDEYGVDGYEMTDTWHVFGDPSLQVRTDTPSLMTVTHEPIIGMGALTFEVDVPGVEDALCVLSRDYTILGYGYTDETGHTLIELEEPAPFCENIDLVVTGYNKIPYITTISVNGEDTPPETPVRPSGRIWGMTNRTYYFTTETTDPEGHLIYYMWDWGDGTFSDWLGSYESGEVCTAEHVWDERGTYEIRVKAKDLYSLESDWSDSFTLRMIKNRALSQPFFSFLERFFPSLFSFLNSLS